MREVTVGNSTGLMELQSRVCPLVGCVAKLDILITTQKAVTSELASQAKMYIVWEVTIENFNWTDGNAVWGVCSMVGRVTKLVILITAQKAVTSKLAT